MAVVFTVNTSELNGVSYGVYNGQKVRLMHIKGYKVLAPPLRESVPVPVRVRVPGDLSQGTAGHSRASGPSDVQVPEFGRQLHPRRRH